LPLEQIYEGGNSKARNPRIQNMLRMIGFGENIGSGFPQIIAAWKDTKWGEPELKNKIDLDEVELILPLVKEQNSNSFRLNNDRKDDRKELTERQKCIIELLIQEPTLTAKAISEKISEKTSEKTSEKFEVSDRTIENDLAQLKKMGILIREGGRKDGRWVVNL
jgi:predicted HTH transcriptional regulator